MYNFKFKLPSILNPFYLSIDFKALNIYSNKEVLIKVPTHYEANIHFKVY